MAAQGMIGTVGTGAAAGGGGGGVHYRDTALQGWQVACRIMQFYIESSQTRT